MRYASLTDETGWHGASQRVTQLPNQDAESGTQTLTVTLISARCLGNLSSYLKGTVTGPGRGR